MAESVHVRLAAHPENPGIFHQTVDATLTRKPGGALEIAYAIHGFNFDLRIPTPHAPAPVDALWKTTCCELFLGSPDHPGYREFNFSPSGQWVAHDFLDTRERAPEPPACPEPIIRTTRTEDLLRVDVTLGAAAVPETARHCLAVSVILEAEGGRLGYWAIVHPCGKPDFHHPAGFVLKLDARGLHT